MGLYSEGNLRFKIDWVSLIVGNKFTIFALFYFEFEGNFRRTSPRDAYIWRGDLTADFLRSRFWGLIFGGAYRWRGLFSEFQGIQIHYLVLLALLVPHMFSSSAVAALGNKRIRTSHRLLSKQKRQNKSHHNSPKSSSSFEFSASSCLRKKRQSEELCLLATCHPLHMTQENHGVFPSYRQLKRSPRRFHCSQSSIFL